MAQTATSGEGATFILVLVVVAAVIAGLVFGGVAGLTMVMVAITPVVLIVAVITSSGS